MQFVYAMGSQLRITMDHLNAQNETFHGPNCLWCRISQRKQGTGTPARIKYATGNELHSSTLGSAEARNAKKAILCVLDTSVDASVVSLVDQCMEALYVKKVMRIGTHQGMGKTQRNVAQAVSWLRRDIEERQLFFVWWIGQDEKLDHNIGQLDGAMASLSASSAVHVMFDGQSHPGLRHSFRWIHTYNPVSERVITVKNPHFVAAYPCAHIWCWQTREKPGQLTGLLCRGNDTLEKRRQNLGQLFRSVAARLWAQSHVEVRLHSNMSQGLKTTFFGMHQ